MTPDLHHAIMDLAFELEIEAVKQHKRASTERVLGNSDDAIIPDTVAVTLDIVVIALRKIAQR